MEHEVVGKLKARLAALRHRRPAGRLKLIVIGGESGKTTTALLLTELLREAGSSVLTLTNHGSFLNGQSISLNYDASADEVHRAMTAARTKGADYVVMELTEALVASHVLPTLSIEMSIVTGQSKLSDNLLDQPVNFTVVPSGMDLGGLSVAPHQAISFGDDLTAESQIIHTKLRRRGTEVDLVVDHQTTFQLATYLVGRANVMNVAAAVSAAYVLAIDMSTLPDGIARVERVVGNYDYIETSQPYGIVVDAATTEASLELLLVSAAQLKKRRLLVAMDAGVAAEQRLAMSRYCDRLVMVGQYEQTPGVDTTDSLESAIELITRGAKKDDIVLLVGPEFAHRESDNATKAHRLLEGERE